MSQSLSELERYYKLTKYILDIIDLVRGYCIGKRRGAITGTDSLEQGVRSCLNKLPKQLELVESLPQSDALVVKYGSGVYSVCGIHGASVHAAVIELARHLSLSPSQWKWLVNRRNASTELNRAKAALKYEIEKVKGKLAKPNQAKSNGSKGRVGAAHKEYHPTPETKRLIKDFKNNVSIDDLSDKYGKSVDAVRQAIRRARKAGLLPPAKRGQRDAT